MTIAKMVRAMIEKGVDPEMIELAVATAESTLSGGNQVDVAAEKRRAWDREYRRNKREIPPESTRHPPDIENASLSKERKKEIEKEERGESKPRVHPTRGHRLPDDWQPTPQDQATAEALIGVDRVGTELAKFRDHWKQQPGSKGVKLDWNAGWRNWIRRAAEYRGGANGHRTDNLRTHQAAGSPATRDATVIAGMAGALERRRAARGPDEAGQQQGIREGRNPGAAGGDDAEPGAAGGDEGARGQLAFLPAANTG